MADIVVAALYKFADLHDFEDMRPKLAAVCDEYGVKGTLLLAKEGINGTIAGSRRGIDAVLAYLHADPRLSDLAHKESFAEEPPFLRMKVRLKKEIVTLGRPEANPNEKVGTYVKPQDWNILISDPDVTVVDTRNDYEFAIGSFKGAIDPKTKSFREFPDYVAENLNPSKNKKVAMFCTGGIRCEKATAYMLDQGFEEVYHLEGGILKYLEETPAEESLWEGECFVFDERVAVGHGLELTDYELCRACRRPVSAEDRQSGKYEEGVSCPACHDEQTAENRARARARIHQVKLAEARNETHVGPRED